MAIWKVKLKTKLLVLVDYSYQPEFFNILAMGQKYLSFYLHFSFNIHRVIYFEISLGKQFFRWLCRFIYKLCQLFFIYHSWYTSNFESTCKKPLFIKVTLCFWCDFSIKLSWLKRRENKTNTIFYDICYFKKLQNYHIRKNYGSYNM